MTPLTSPVLQKVALMTQTRWTISSPERSTILLSFLILLFVISISFFAFQQINLIASTIYYSTLSFDHSLSHSNHILHDKISWSQSLSLYQNSTRLEIQSPAPNLLHTKNTLPTTSISSPQSNPLHRIYLSLNALPKSCVCAHKSAGSNMCHRMLERIVFFLRIIWRILMLVR